ncbi:hypothetical protein H6F47_03745 [Sphaerospermopsis sp. FACHB-1094]|uniref:Uncharacterized protein n=1 Tax=Sphaerospermopsis reniformis TaxID=531300 RepID=A0A480A2N4_9CYAN|nr:MULTISPECIES: hypothetical protein [Sphaerospermopsis]MBD2131588.1 hypothetical protein [Sphaerospermopsis sp. FACHB-1094]GCL38752.1 hypothetical protein SR1949_38710 [Sphaerospermopsis reniformis]
MLVEKYETENHPLEPAKPLQVLQHLMEERGMDEADLLNILGLKEGDQEAILFFKVIVISMQNKLKF